MNELRIITAENGTIVYEGVENYTVGKCWAFESPETLATFIEEWRRDFDKPKEKIGADL